MNEIEDYEFINYPDDEKIGDINNIKSNNLNAEELNSNQLNVECVNDDNCNNFEIEENLHKSPIVKNTSVDVSIDVSLNTSLDIYRDNDNTNYDDDSAYLPLMCIDHILMSPTNFTAPTRKQNFIYTNNNTLNNNNLFYFTPKCNFKFIINTFKATSLLVGDLVKEFICEPVTSTNHQSDVIAAELCEHLAVFGIPLFH